jgi:hypothetical protein
VQAVVDLAGLKDSHGKCRREAPDVVAMAARLRALLEQGGAAA